MNNGESPKKLKLKNVKSRGEMSNGLDVPDVHQRSIMGGNGAQKVNLSANWTRRGGAARTT